MKMPAKWKPNEKPKTHKATALIRLMVRVSLILRGPRAASSILPPSRGITGTQLKTAHMILKTQRNPTKFFIIESGNEMKSWAMNIAAPNKAWSNGPARVTRNDCFLDKTPMGWVA